MTQAYSDPRREGDPTALPDLEVWSEMSKVCADCGAEWPEDYDGCNCPLSADVAAYEPGSMRWWWWTCLPGCLPDSEPYGPFATEEAALDDARLQAGIDEMEG